MFKQLTVAAITVTSLSACGKEIVYIEAEPSTPATVLSTTTEPPATTVAPTTTQAPPPETRPTIPVTTEPPMNGYQPDLFIDVVKEWAPYWYWNYTDENLLNIALSACEWLDAGTGIEDVLLESLWMVQDIDPALGDDIGIVMRAIVRYVCPEHFGQIEALHGST